MNQELFRPNDRNIGSAKKITIIVYALQAASFFIGITFLIAIIINYVKKEDVQGTWLASHFRWQIRTFWFSILWNFIGVITVFTIGYPIFILTLVWTIYRIVKGWVRLADEKEMYV
uniref:Uncharacterized membrane protein n=1 Tax=Candidatus Kentrum sp. FW TaxID=2126338 RepID=A0A450U247_9GAMM|nr:MAG: Uncharacterized membrane protein [Candidatus Kentron sp. FW]